MIGIKEKLSLRTKFVGFSSEDEVMKKIKEGLPDALNLATGIWPPEFTLPEHITEACKKVIDKKPDYRPFGLPELRRAIAEKLEKENGIEVDPDKQVLITTGGMEAIYLVFLTFVDLGDEVTMGDPGYFLTHEADVLMAGGRVLQIPVREERNFELDPGNLEKRLTRNTKIISIISPENPTGAVMKKDDLEVIAEVAKRHDLIVLSNEIYEKLVYDGRANISIASFPGMEDRTLTINGFSKSYDLHGHRVGYIVGPESAIRKMMDIQYHTTFSVNDVGQYAALAALTGPQNWIVEAVKEFERRRDLFVKKLNQIEGIKCQMPDGAMYAFPNVKAFGLTSFELSKYLLEKAHVWVHRGTYFGPNGEGYLRICFLRSIDVLLEALDRMKTALEGLKPQSTVSKE